MMQRTYSDIEIFVMDNYKKKLESLRKNCSVYDVSGEQCKDVLINLDVYLHNKYQQLVEGDDVNSAWKLLIINNEDVFQTISGDKAALAAFKNIIGKLNLKEYIKTENLELCISHMNMQIQIRGINYTI